MTAIEEVNLEKILPSNGPSINEVKKYLKKYSDEKIVIKCGGSVLIDPNLFNLFISDVVIIKKLGLTPVIVHGGGKRINIKLKELNIESTFIKGLRVTNKDTIKVVEDVLIEFNNEIINTLRNQKCATKSITTKENNIILDPGIGFSKTIEHNFEIINQLEELTSLDYPLLIGASNKSFIGKTLDVGEDDRLQGTIVSNTVAFAKGCKIFRVHNVKETKRSLTIANKIFNSNGLNT